MRFVKSLKYWKIGFFIDITTAYELKRIPNKRFSKERKKERKISVSLRVLCLIWQTSHRYLNQKQKFKINTSKLIKSKNFLKKFSKLIFIRCVSTFTNILFCLYVKCFLTWAPDFFLPDIPKMTRKICRRNSTSIHQFKQNSNRYKLTLLS